MKLKTVEDCASGRGSDIDGEFVGELQQAAKEWVKELEKHIEIKGDLSLSNAEICWKNSEKTVRTAMAQIEFLKHFFNLEPITKGVKHKNEQKTK